jgi:hypothetical protein
MADDGTRQPADDAAGSETNPNVPKEAGEHKSVAKKRNGKPNVPRKAGQHKGNWKK